MKAYEVVTPSGLDGLRFNPERADPKPGDNDIVVSVRAASLNYRDHGVLRGAYSYSKFPVIPLSDGAGEVVAVGAKVRRFKVGDRVASTFFQTWLSGRIPLDASRHSLGGMVDGMLTEFALLSEEGAVSIPDHLSFEEACTLPCAALTAWNALVEVGTLRAGETVLILGTGGVSTFGLQFANLHGARAIVISSSDAKLDQAKALGAHALINYRAAPEWQQEVRQIVGEAGVDHVLEVGGAGTLERSMEAVRPGGSIYVIGAVAGQGTVNPRPINRRSIRLLGVHVGSREMFEAMNRAITTAELRPVIDRVFPFSDGKQAFKHQAEQRHFGKVVISVHN